MDLLSTSYLLVTLTDIDIKTEEKENVRLIYVHEFVLKPLFKLLLFVSIDPRKGSKFEKKVSRRGRS